MKIKIGQLTRWGIEQTIRLGELIDDEDKLDQRDDHDDDCNDDDHDADADAENNVDQV